MPVQSLLIVTFMLLVCVGPVVCFQCYNDICEAGYQYCVHERRRCYHCKDMASPCDRTTMNPDCKAYCNDVALQDKIQSLEETVRNITEQKENAYHRLNESDNENVALRKTVKEWKTMFWIVLTVFCTVLLLVICVVAYLLFSGKKNITTSLGGPAKMGLIDDEEEIINGRNHTSLGRPEGKGLLDGEEENINGRNTFLTYKVEYKKPVVETGRRGSKDSAVGSTSSVNTGTCDISVDQAHENRRDFDNPDVTETRRKGSTPVEREESPISEGFIVCSPAEHDKETNFIGQQPLSKDYNLD